MKKSKYNLKLKVANGSIPQPQGNKRPYQISLVSYLFSTKKQKTPRRLPRIADSPSPPGKLRIAVT